MAIILFYFLVYTIEGVTFFQYNSTVFSPCYDKQIQYRSLIISYFTLFSIYLFHDPYANFLSFCLINFLYLILINHLSIFTALFHTFVIVASMNLCEVIFFMFFSQISYHYSEGNYLIKDYILATVLSKLLYFFILYFISHHVIKTNETHKYKHKEHSVLYIVPVMSTCIVFIYLHICTTVKLTQTANYLISISAIFLLFINVIIFGLYSDMQKKSAAFTQMQIQLQKEADFAEYYKTLIEQDEQQKILLHDIKNHLQSIASLNEQHDTEKISAYLTQLLQSQDLKTSVRMCDNELLNAILCRYSRICVADRIDFHVDVRSHCIDFVSSDDLTALFCNLLDNAVESCRKSTSSFLELSVSKRENTNFCVITMENSSRINPFSGHDGQLITQKKDPSRHGFGLKSIQRITSKYSGELRTYYDTEHHSFHIIIMLKDYSSVYASTRFS